MNYNCVLYSKTKNQQLASVCLTGVNAPKELDNAVKNAVCEIDVYIKKNDYKDGSWSMQSRDINCIQTEFGDSETCCTAFEFVYIVFNTIMETEPQAAITEIGYDDVVYRNISGTKKLENETGIFGVFSSTSSYSFLAEKEGLPHKVYAFPGYDFSENGTIMGKFSGHGIVDIPVDTGAKKLMYIGCYNVYAEGEYDIGYGRVYDKAHIFLEAGQGNIAFKVLIDNKLYNKMSYINGDSFVFSFTPFETTSYQEDTYIDPDRCTIDMIFRLTDGKYVYNSNFGFSKVVLTPPDIPALENIDEESACRLYESFSKMFYECFFTAKEYKRGRYVFERQEETDVFCAKSEDVRIFADFKNGYWLSPDIYFHESLDSPYDLFINSIEVSKSNCVIELNNFRRNDLNIKVTNRKGEAVEQSFVKLKKHNVFKSKDNIPENIYFKNGWVGCFFENLSMLISIAEAVADFGYSGVADVGKSADKSFINSFDEMQNAIYDVGMTPDADVVTKALELNRKYNRTGVIPNVAIIGEAGCGKSTLIKKLGKVFGKEVLCLSPSDLKGAYVGHTKMVVTEQLILAMKENKIFFIDEVYELMSDSFGKEAVSLLLPLMTGDRTRIECSFDKKVISVDFMSGEVVTNGEREVYPNSKGIPPIWIAGYEDDVRLMLSQNQGLFRRFERLTLKSPRTIELYDDLMKKLKAMLDSDKTRMMYNCLKKLFDDNKKLIINYFHWGTQPQNSKYFANFAGVERLLNSCIDRLSFDKTEDELRSELESIISGSKRDIKRQLHTIIRKGDNSGGKGINDADQIEIISDIDTRFDDLVGCGAQVEYMRTIIRLLLNKSKYDSYNITVPKGALLKGRPGVGKTFISRAFAGELQEAFEKEAPDKRVGFMVLSAPEIVSKSVDFIGAVFDAAEEYDFCVIFIDEVDSIARRRIINRHFGHYLELIKQMDGIEKRSNIFILAATNAPEILDPAFIRSGRIDKEFEFELPDDEARTILAERIILKRIRLLNNYVYNENDSFVSELSKEVARNTWGYTAGDIENVINMAYIMYDNESGEIQPKQKGRKEAVYRFGHSELDRLCGYILEAIERKNIGEPNPSAKEKTFSVETNNSNCSAVAIHEVGHALVSVICGEKPFEKITILPRGNALGYVSHSGFSSNTLSGFRKRICSAMGGRIAEALIYGEENVSTGASQDMETATKLARCMVEKIGFTKDIGFMTLVQSTAGFLGEEKYTCSDAFRKSVDEVVCKLLRELYEETENMLKDKKELIIKLAECVFEAETMTGREFVELYEKISGVEQTSD